MADESSRPDGSLTTPQLVAEIERVYGVRVSRQAVRSWMQRAEHPLPAEYVGVNGQAHCFRWDAFADWWEEEAARIDRRGSAEIDSMDWHAAKTVSARERAKRDVIETGLLEGRYGDTAEMEATAEDRARRAVQALRAIPSRLAPRLVGKHDELAIYREIEEEIIRVCGDISRDATKHLGDDFDDAGPDEAA